MSVLDQLGELDSTTKGIVVFSLILVALAMAFLVTECINRVVSKIALRSKKIRDIALVLEEEGSYRLIIPKYDKVVTVDKKDGSNLIDKSVVGIVTDTRWERVKIGREKDIKTEETWVKGVVVKELNNYTYVIQDNDGNRVSIRNLAKELLIGDTLEVSLINIEGLENPLMLSYKIKQ